MTERRDINDSGEQRSTEKADDRVAESGHSQVDPPTRDQWEQLPADPDVRDNLGYRIAEWEEFTTLDGSDQMMFLPEDKGLLREDAFVVAAKDCVVDLGEKC